MISLIVNFMMVMKRWDPKTARFFLDSEVSEEISGHVVKIIENISFKGGNFKDLLLYKN
jgi:hypothetical protein